MISERTGSAKAKVLPEPVWPYAITHAFIPCKIVVLISSKIVSQNYSFSCSGGKILLKLNL
jgi:hypothetical protein